MLNSMGWSQADFDLFSPLAPTPHADKLARQYGWPLTSPVSSLGTKLIQVDVGRHPIGDPGHTAQVKDRVAMVVSPTHPDLRDRKELILVWIAIHLRTAA